MQQRNISRPRKHKWHIFETSFWIMNWSWQPWGISRGGFFHGSEPPKMQLGDSLYECFFFRKELDNYNSISYIYHNLFWRFVCLEVFFWLFSVLINPHHPPNHAKIPMTFEERKATYETAKLNIQQNKVGLWWCLSGCWGFLTNVFSRNWHPKVILENHFSSLKNQTNPIKIQYRICTYLLRFSYPQQ